MSGSSGSAAALRWTAGEGRRRHAALRVVQGWDAEPRAPYAPGGARPTDAQQLAAGELARALSLAFGPELPAELVRGVPERVLIDRSAEADLLVLGSATPPSPAGPGRPARWCGPACTAPSARSWSWAHPGRPARPGPEPGAGQPLDDLCEGFATITAAVEAGRRVYDNVRKFILYIFYIFAHAVPIRIRAREGAHESSG